MVQCEPTQLTGYMGSNGNLQLQISSANGFAVGQYSEAILDKPANTVATVYNNGVKKSTVAFDNYDGRKICFGALGELSGVSNCTRAKIYGAYVEIGDTRVREFIPVYETASEKYGMLDIISGDFFGNAGSGNFGGEKKSTEEMVNENSQVLTPYDHTLTARWEPETENALTLNMNQSTGKIQEIKTR